MSNKWLQREGPLWVEKKIITEDQLNEILKLYPASPSRLTQILPIFASILLGLSLLTFVASNWEGMSHLFRMGVLVAAMLGLYTSGYYLYHKGHTWVGQGLLGLGVVSFGASMILIGQMFHLMAYDARLFIFWALAGMGMLYLYRQTFFYILTAILIFAGQVYAMSSLNEASWGLLALTIIGLGMFAYPSKQSSLGWILGFLVGLQMILIIVSEDVAWSWITLVPLGLYVIGLSLGEKPIAHGFLGWPTAFSFAFCTLMIFIHEHTYTDQEFLADSVPYLIFFTILFLLAVWQSRGQYGKRLSLILFLPLFFLSFGDMVYLAVMFIFASLLLYFGDQEGHRWKSNIGVFLFMFSSFVGYIQLAWDFLDKSLFFLVGGFLLFAIHWILRRRNGWLGKGGE